MSLWHDFLSGVLPYQGYWLPLLIGVAAGMLCIFVGNFVGVWRKRASAKSASVNAVSSPAYDPFVQGSATDHRKSLRRGGNTVVALYATTENRQLAKRALVLNRSLGGLRLGAEEEVAVGTKLVVLPPGATESTPWIEVEVRTCRRVEDCWELGCQFVKTPPWSTLLMFG